MAFQEPVKPSEEPKMAPPRPRPEMITSKEKAVTTTYLDLPCKYSKRVILKSILERSDGGAGLVGERVVVGGWVKSSRTVKKEPTLAPQPQASDGPNVSPGTKDVSCVEIFQARIPIFRSIIKILGGGSSGGGSNYPVRQKLEPAVPKPPLSSVAYLLVNDGSSVASLQLVVESSIASPSQLLPTGTCILAEGVLQQSSAQGKHIIELKVEKVVHIGTVDQDKYPLSKKRLPLETLRDCSHFRPRTTTVATVIRIRSALTFASQTFFHDNGFLNVQMPVITTIDGEEFSEKVQVTTLLGKEAAGKKEIASEDTGRVSHEVVKDAIREKSSVVEELKRSESNRETAVAALQDLHKTNQLASQLGAKERPKSTPSIKAIFPGAGDFFSRRTYLSFSGLLHLETHTCALGNVFSFGPRFRAHRKDSAKQVAEMWMVEVQMAFSELEDAMNCADDYFKFLCKWVLKHCSEDMKFVSKRIDKTSIARLESMISCSIEKISYMEALDILIKKVEDRTFETKLEWGIALTPEHLSYLADNVYKRPVIIYNYPKEQKPFYARLNDDGKTVAAFDMIAPKVGTIISGSQSEERIAMLNSRIGYKLSEQHDYEWYLDLRRQGTVKHSGFSVWFDLILLFTTGLTDVRDVIPFPRSYGKVNY